VSNLPSSSKFNYRNEWYSLAPPWLTTGNAERYIYTLQLCTDLLLEKMNQAIRIRWPGLGDVSQLPYLANDRVLVQGPGESDASFTARLQNAFAAWGLAGAARAALEELQAYMQNLQPGVPSTNVLATIVSSNGTGGSSIAKWSQLYQGDALQALPTVTQVSPSNFNWGDPQEGSWWSWLILPMTLVPTGQSGPSAAITTATGGSYASPGQNVNGVWVPATSGTPVNTPFLTITGLSGIVASNLGQWITLTSALHAGNNGTFPIVQVLSSTSVLIANPNGVASDSGLVGIQWSIGEYPWIGPGMPYGSPGVVYGQGELTTPPVDTGENFRGTWQPTVGLGLPTNGPTISWGLDVSSQVIVSLRSLVKTWKSAGTYYKAIVIAFDGGTGIAGSAYSPNSSQGSGNPDGTFGSVGKNVAGVWVPTRLITSEQDCYCQGTGTANACSVENET
jgi:hypothetical protein